MIPRSVDGRPVMVMVVTMGGYWISALVDTGARKVKRTHYVHIIHQTAPEHQDSEVGCLTSRVWGKQNM